MQDKNFVRFLPEAPENENSAEAKNAGDFAPIAEADILDAYFVVSIAAGEGKRLTVREILGKVEAGDLIIPTFAVRTAYAKDEGFTAEGVLYRAKAAIAAASTKSVAQLLSDDEIEAIGLTLEQTELLARISGIDIRDFRVAIPAPPAHDADTKLLDLAKKTIGIGDHGTNYTFELLVRGGTWAEFVNDKYEGAFASQLPGSALQDGDFYYVPNGGAGPQHGAWFHVSGLTTSETEDVNTFLPNHHFLGNFTSQKAAENAIKDYDARITYLAYFPTTISGETGRIVQRLTTFVDVAAPTTRWVPSDEELHSLFNELETQVLKERDRISANIITIDNIRNQQREDSGRIDKAALRFPIDDFSDWTFDASNSGAIGVGRYRRTETTLTIHHTDNNNEDKSEEFSRILPYHAIVIGTHRFIITEKRTNSDNTEFTGYWEKIGGIDTTANNVAKSIRLILKHCRFGPWTQAADIVGFEKEAEKHIGDNAPLTRFETIEKDGQKGIPTRADFAGNYILYMRGAHAKLQRATKIDINFGGLEIAEGVAWQHNELLAYFSISASRALTLGNNLSNNDTKVEVQITFREADDTFVDRVDIDFGIGPAYATYVVLLAWDETRTAKTHTLPENYTDYRHFRAVLRDGNNENPVSYPIAALQDPRRDNSNNPGIRQLSQRASEKLEFNRATRVLTGVGNDVDGITYLELFR